MHCEGKVALITGAAGNGLGRSIALTLAREGAQVVVNYRTSEASARAMVEYIGSKGGQALAVSANVMEAEGCRKLVETTVERFGRVDICIIGPGGGWHPETIDQLDPDVVLGDIRQESAPLLYMLPKILPGMYERKWGRIIGIVTHPVKLSPAYAYNLGKMARMQALLLAQDQAWWEHGITVNAIAPGPVAGLDSLASAIKHVQHESVWQTRTNVTPQDIAEGVAFLCSEAGQYITGCVLPYLFH